MALTRRLILPGLAAAAALPASLAQAQSPAPAEPRRYSVGDARLGARITDLSPKFLAFYAAAQGEPDPDKRFALWKTMYGFAAVPPGPRGDAMARQLLDKGWDKYAAALPVIRAGSEAMRPDALTTLRKVAAVLKPEEPLTIKVVAYVGAFDGNAFSYRGDDGVPTVCVPIEMSVHDREALFPHEMTHVVHRAIAHVAGGWGGWIAANGVQGGLARKVSRVVAPGRNVRAYVEASPGWFDKAQARRRAILEGILPVLDTRDGETVFKFTMGQGNTGLEREAYYVGWVVMEALRARGMSWARVARVPEDGMTALVRSTIQEVLGECG